MGSSYVGSRNRSKSDETCKYFELYSNCQKNPISKKSLTFDFKKKL